MATFVLVHGAWCGGWTWKKVSPLLRAAGHEVYTPTLTGDGERVHLLTPDTGLDTHIQDIVNVLAYEDLHDVLLVGHSYAGMVIAGVAQRVPERLRHLIHLDATYPIADNRSMMELLRLINPPMIAVREAQIRESGDRCTVPPPPRDAVFGMTDAGDIAWLHDHFTPHPSKAWLQRVEGNAATDGILPRTFIFCPEPGATTRSPYAEHAQREGWGYHELAGGHFVMVTMPNELTELLSTLATETARIPDNPHGEVHEHPPDRDGTRDGDDSPTERAGGSGAL